MAVKFPDPVETELLKNALSAITDEMAVTVIRTARSSVVKEAMDFSTGLIDPDGELLAQGLCLPLHMGSFPPAIEAVLKKYKEDIAPGDVYVLNDPYEAGGSHLPDIYVFKPVFLDGRLLGFAAAIAHHADIGGRVAGGNASDSTEIYQEGLRIPVLKLFDRGRENETFLELLKLNVRVPELVVGDLMATVAACNRGEAGLLKLAKRRGADRLREELRTLLDYSEQLTRAELEALPDGEWTFEDYLDDDGFESGPIRIAVKLVKHGGGLTADFSGTSRQVKGAINTTYAFVYSCVYACVRSVLDASIPNNSGFFRPINVMVEQGTITNSVAPAPVAARGLTAMRVADAVFGALGKMLPHKVFACGVGADFGVTIAGYAPDGEPFVHLEFLYGSWGGAPHRDGTDAVSSLVSNYANTPVEVIEAEHPFRIEQYSLRANSGGPGLHRGGLGVVRDYHLIGVDEAVLQVRIDRQKFAPYGVNGGKPGAYASSLINPDSADEEVIEGKFLRTLRRGETFRAILAGSGGWGDPMERDPTLVLNDVIEGKVSLEGARRDYGVVIEPDSPQVNHAATAELRSRERSTDGA
jgi:N-methylhydantoinase B